MLQSLSWTPIGPSYDMHGLVADRRTHDRRNMSFPSFLNWPIGGGGDGIGTCTTTDRALIRCSQHLVRSSWYVALVLGIKDRERLVWATHGVRRLGSSVGCVASHLSMRLQPFPRHELGARRPWRA